MKSLNNFAALEVTNTEDVKGGLFGLFSLFGGFCAPKPVVCTPPPAPAPAPCYTAPKPSCNTGGYNHNPAPVVCKPRPSRYRGC